MIGDFYAEKGLMKNNAFYVLQAAIIPMHFLKELLSRKGINNKLYIL